MKELIKKFLDTFGTIVTDGEASAYVDLMMDSHFCINYECQEWYIPENNMLYTPDDELLVEFLKYKYEL